MAFPPQFLDELRARVALADVVARRTKLTRRGRESIGLCPFHKEKSPSFYVYPDHYHCFGCGAHGDVIGFVMQTGNLEFLEAVEVLAREAGLEVPKPSRDAQERSHRQTDLQVVMERACGFFEESLAGPLGREARTYLDGRGLDAAAIRQFRLGFAPDSRDALKRALGGEIDEALLIEGGLLRRPEEGASYDYFRHRVMFPIGNRSGKVIAFGGRVLGDGQPKYLNSPETPLFQKGRVLYGWATARAAASHDASAIVTEGYMDVIALQRAGFETAVAPLGTALTEGQLEEIWRLAPEPILCFDGDAAGQRAAGRALERALPMLAAERSLRFATLPAGEDPDTLIRRQGAVAMREILDAARPLVEVLWSLETARPVDTPERRAALEKRLEERVRVIEDRSVQQHYRQFFRDRLYELLSTRRLQRTGGPVRTGASRGGGRWPQRSVAMVEPPLSSNPGALRRRQQEVALALLLNHPFLLSEVEEDVATLDFSAPDLDRLRGAILKARAHHADLDAASLKLHLNRQGFAGILEGVLSPQVLVHAGFARADADTDMVRAGWEHTKSRFEQRRLSSQVAEAERDLARDMTNDQWARLHHTLREQDVDDEDATGGDTR